MLKGLNERLGKWIISVFSVNLDRNMEDSEILVQVRKRAQREGKKLQKLFDMLDPGYVEETSSISSGTDTIGSVAPVRIPKKMTEDQRAELVSNLIITQVNKYMEYSAVQCIQYLAKLCDPKQLLFRAYANMLLSHNFSFPGWSRYFSDDLTWSAENDLALYILMHVLRYAEYSQHLNTVGAATAYKSALLDHLVVEINRVTGIFNDYYAFIGSKENTEILEHVGFDMASVSGIIKDKMIVEFDSLLLLTRPLVTNHSTGEKFKSNEAISSILENVMNSSVSAAALVPAFVQQVEGAEQMMISKIPAQVAQAHPPALRPVDKKSSPLGTFGSTGMTGGSNHSFSPVFPEIHADNKFVLKTLGVKPGKAVESPVAKKSVTKPKSKSKGKSTKTKTTKA